MDKSKAIELGERHVIPLLSFLGIGYWRVSLIVGHIETEDGSNRSGECEALEDQEVAMIRINHDLVEDEEEFLATLYHECCHILLSPFQRHARLVERVLKGDCQEMSRTSWYQASEAVVCVMARNWRDKMRAIYGKYLKHFEEMRTDGKVSY